MSIVPAISDTAMAAMTDILTIPQRSKLALCLTYYIYHNEPILTTQNLDIIVNFDLSLQSFYNRLLSEA